MTLALSLALALAACGGEKTTTSTVSPPADGAAESDSPGEDPQRPEEPEAPVLSSEARGDLERFAANAAGEVGIAVSPLGSGEVIEIGDAPTGRAWSTMKVPLLVALIDRLGGAGELSAVERSQAEAALTASDNEAALALFDRLQDLEGGLVPASRAIQAVLRRSGDTQTTVNTKPSPEGYSTFGQTIWSAEASTRFFRALAGGCLLSREDTDFVISLMERIVPDQRWGLGETDTPGGASVAFKGGWGPESGGGYLVREGGVIADDDAGYVVTIIAIPDEVGAASFPAGQDLVTEAATLVAEEAGAGSRAQVTCEP